MESLMILFSGTEFETDSLNPLWFPSSGKQTMTKLLTLIHWFLTYKICITKHCYNSIIPVCITAENSAVKML